MWLTVVVAAFLGGTRSERFLKQGRPYPMERRIWVALDEQTSLDFNEQPLRDVLEYLKQRHDFLITIDEGALRDVGVRSDSPVTCSFSGPLHSALDLLLNDLGLTYEIGSGVLTVTRMQPAYPWFRFQTLLWGAAAVVAFAGGATFAWKRGHRATAAAPPTGPDRSNSPMRRQFFFKTMLWLIVVAGALWTGMWWPAIAPAWGKPSYEEPRYGWGKFRWWTGRVEVVKWIPDSAMTTPDSSPH